MTKKLVENAKWYVLAESCGPQDSESKRILGKESTVKKVQLQNIKQKAGGTS
jgi:hypothetical protein